MQNIEFENFPIDRCKALRTPANILVINLTLSDFIMLAKCPLAAYNSFKMGPALGDLGCRFYGFIGGLTGTVSIATLTAISIDRYHVVVYPLDPLKSTTRRRVWFMILFIWLYSFAFSIVPAIDIGFSHYVPEGFLTTCSFDYLDKSTKAKIFMFVFFIAAWCAPFIIISYCYFYILKVVMSANNIQSSKDKNKTETKLAIVIIAVITMWFLAWTPYSVVALFGIFDQKDKLTPLVSMIPAIFCKSSACVNPYIYALSHPRFRNEFKRIFLGYHVQRVSTYHSTLTSQCSTKQHVSERRISDTKNICEIPTISSAIKNDASPSKEASNIL